MFELFLFFCHYCASPPKWKQIHHKLNFSFESQNVMSSVLSLFLTLFFVWIFVWLFFSLKRLISKLSLFDCLFVLISKLVSFWHFCLILKTFCSWKNVLHFCLRLKTFCFLENVFCLENVLQTHQCDLLMLTKLKGCGHQSLMNEICFFYICLFPLERL